MRKVLLVGVDPRITIEQAAHLKEQIESDLPDRTVRIVAGMTVAHDLEVNEVTSHAD
jgi:hypothetical protein